MKRRDRCYLLKRHHEKVWNRLAKYLDITVDELYQDIDDAAEKAHSDWAFNADIFEQEIASTVENLQPLEHIDSARCFLCLVD